MKLKMKFEVDIEINSEGSKPTIDVVETPNEGYLACLYNWDIEEKMDGFTVDEINELITGLITVRNHIVEQEMDLNV